MVQVQAGYAFSCYGFCAWKKQGHLCTPLISDCEYHVTSIQQGQFGDEIQSHGLKWVHLCLRGYQI